MKRVMLTLTCFLIGSTLWAQAIDCKQSLECFIKAAAKCNQAMVFIEESNQNAEISYKVKRQAIIHGYSGTKCLYEDLIQTLNLELSSSLRAESEQKGWSEDLIQGQIRSFARTLELEKGLVRECELSSSELISLLEEAFQDKKYNKEKWAACKRRKISTETLADTKRPPVEKKKVEEDEEEEEDEGEEEVDTTLPTYLQYPYYFNAVDFLRNSMADISPYLARRVKRAQLSIPKFKEEGSKLESPITSSEEKKIETEPMLIFKSTTGGIELPSTVAAPSKSESSRYEPSERSFKDLSKNERIQLIIKRRPPPAGKTRLYPQMGYEEMVKAGFSNEEIGNFVFKRAQEERAALNKMASCSEGCSSGTYCQKMLKRCVQCSGPSDCPGAQICLNYRCVSGDTVLKPEKKK